MAGIQKAPILHHFSESVSGVVTIRCFSQEEKFFTTNVNLINDFSRIAFFNSATMEWLCVRINFLFNLGFFSVLVILVSTSSSVTNPSKHLFALLCIIILKFSVSSFVPFRYDSSSWSVQAQIAQINHILDLFKSTLLLLIWPTSLRTNC